MKTRNLIALKLLFLAAALVAQQPDNTVYVKSFYFSGATVGQMVARARLHVIRMHRFPALS